MNENEVKVFDENIEEEVIMDYEVLDEETGTDMSGIVAIGAVGILGTIGALVYKNRDKIKDKIEQRRAKKLEKSGYVVYKPETVYDEECDVVCDEATEEN